MKIGSIAIAAVFAFGAPYAPAAAQTRPAEAWVFCWAQLSSPYRFASTPAFRVNGNAYALGWDTVGPVWGIQYYNTRDMIGQFQNGDLPAPVGSAATGGRRECVQTTSFDLIVTQIAELRQRAPVVLEPLKDWRPNAEYATGILEVREIPR